MSRARVVKPGAFVNSVDAQLCGLVAGPRPCPSQIDVTYGVQKSNKIREQELNLDQKFVLMVATHTDGGQKSGPVNDEHTLEQYRS